MDLNLLNAMFYSGLSKIFYNRRKNQRKSANNKGFLTYANIIS